MGIFKKITSHPNFLPLVVVVFLGFLAARMLLVPGYFNMHDDLQMMRQLEMEKCFRDLQIPCRWVPDMGYGYGYPLFNYYPPLPYLVGQGIRILGFSFVDTVKLTFFLSFILSGITMYLLAREFWGRLGGVLSAGFYIWAPYHAVDVYVRGAMNEAWALVWLPLILWSSYKLVVARSSVSLAPQFSLKWIIILSLSWFVLLVSHNIMVLIFTPLFAVWCLFWLWRDSQTSQPRLTWRKRAAGRIPQLFISGIWAVGLAAFFTIPVLFEQKLVHLETLTVGYYEYIAHFANLNQLFISRFWGYGPSIWGEKDGMSFQIGHIHWILSLVIGLLLLVKLIRKEKLSFNLFFVVLFLLLAGWGASFMAHVRSTPIWLSLPFLSIIQFPWRFLTIVILSFSLLAGSLVPILNSLKWPARAIVTFLIIGVVLFNNEYFRPEKMGPLTDEEKFSGAAWELQQTAGIYDYLPKDAKIAPQGPRIVPVEIIEGEGEVGATQEGTRWLVSKIRVTSDESKVRINIFQFSNWKVFARPAEASAKEGGWKELKVSTNNDELGRIHVVVPQGEHEIEAHLFNTPARTVANLISLVSWISLFTLPLWRKKLGPARM